MDLRCTSASLVLPSLKLWHVSGEVCRKWENDSRHSGEETLPVITPSTKSLQPTHSLPMPTSITGFITSSYCTHTVRFPYARSDLSVLMVLHEMLTYLRDICITQSLPEKRQGNRFINCADMQIREDELQILCDKVSSTAGFLGRLSSEGCCCCYHGGPSPCN